VSAKSDPAVPLFGWAKNEKIRFSPTGREAARIRTMTAIRDKLRAPPVREPLPPLRHYEPPRAKASRRRG
jgi:hypothetical protein